ncbi:MAG: hypothetical protein WCI01_03350 [Chlorobiaceae bacterium]
METTVDGAKGLMLRMYKKTLPGLAFVNPVMQKELYNQRKPISSADCECGGQCLSGCKDECITVSKA